MPFPKRLIVCAGLAAALSGCTTFGTNIQGEFTCRAPKGGCAPSHVIDAGATAALEQARSSPELAWVRTGVAAGDTGRTSERTLKIVFPAHVDEAGTLHDEAVAWAVVENPRWAAELRRRQLKAAQAADDSAAKESGDEADADLGSPFSPAALPIPDSPVASPLVLPSTAREAVAGAKAPAVEGFDMSPPPHDRTPRPGGEAPLIYPSVEAIEAAKAPNGADNGTTFEPAPADREPK
jgi:conjugal transfer pilus assembly protein TraV